ncbi:MAG: PilZ domain-containing protein [Blastocatellia bacterium]|nr:PilZ domain-containing protein [Blastocatellia bacterium]
MQSSSSKQKKSKPEVTGEDIQAIIKSKTADGEPWKELADVINLSATGAGLYMPRACKVGSLISLMIPMPAHLRCYDYEKDFYRVWGLVQHCQKLADAALGYHVGVAFIGKDAPESYNSDPEQNFRITGMTEEGLWRVDSVETEFRKRRHVRYWQEIDLYLAMLDPKMASGKGERTVTENISKSGASVFSKLDLNVGDRVKFISERFNFSGLAVVCNRNVGPDKRPRVHLEFVEEQFPIDLIERKAAKEKALA